MSKQTCPEQGEHWITDKSGQHMYKCPKCGGAKGHWISDNGWTATWKPCKACSGFVTDSGTGEAIKHKTALGNANYVHACNKCDICGGCDMECVHQITSTLTVSAPQPSEAEGKPVPAPNPPIPDELEQLLQKLSAAAWSMGLQNASPEELKNDRQNSMTVRKAHAAITRLYAGREAAARVDELEQVIIAHYAIEGAKRDRTFAEHLSARLASLREGGAK